MSEGKILFYASTRPVSVFYPAGLAYAVHLEYSRPGEERQQLNRDYGILFAKGAVSPEDTIVPVGVVNPLLFDMEDGWIGISGEPVDERGAPAADSKGKVFLWKTRDLIRFEETGPVSAASLARYHPAGSLAVDAETAEKAIRYWSPVRLQSVSVPEQMAACSAADLKQVRAELFYSDGSKREARIDWHTGNTDFTAPGEKTVEGVLKKHAFPFPLAEGYGDPVIFRRENKWYFLGTNDNLDDIGLYIREAESPEGLFAPGIEQHLILPFDKERGFEQTFWAPEMHVIGGEAYILFAVSGHVWGPQCHLMKLKKGGRMIRAEDWEDPVPVVRKDGSPLSTDGITLDMTCIQAESGIYMVWSYRRHIGTPRDTGSMLYIATADEREPWKLTSDPVLLTRPLYGWENVSGTINNEGPNAFIRDGKVYLTYSGGSANAYTYALGLLTAESKADLTELSSWTKSIQPVLTFRSVEGEYGPGHNSFFISDQDELMIAYHAETSIDGHLRCDGIRRVHFRTDGTPYFQMSSEEDLPEGKRKVHIRIRER